MKSHIEGGATVPVDTERDMTVKDALRLWPKAILFSFLISMAIIMEVNTFPIFLTYGNGISLTWPFYLGL